MNYTRMIQWIRSEKIKLHSCGIPYRAIDIASEDDTRGNPRKVERGTVFCCVCPDAGAGCHQRETPARVAAFEAYVAKLRAHNEKCNGERRRYGRRRTEEAVNRMRRAIG